MRAVAAALLLALLLGACAAVQPWERADLARRVMTSGRPDLSVQAAYWRKVQETLTAGTLSTTAAGGGCGCTQ